MGGVTAYLAHWIASRSDPATPRARRAATHAVLDWTGVTLAGAGDPLVSLLATDALADGGPGVHVAIGTDTRLTARDAARVNGAASHALDFDDINTRMRGHPTVAILPAVLAAGEAHTGAEVIEALIVGTEVACILGEMMGEAHYMRGFHMTATVGAVAAAAGVCRILNADADQTARALSLAATQASGLRAMFGTMAKPLHAGLAAERGLLAARWAVAGMTAPTDGIESPQGFGPVLSGTFKPLQIRPDPGASFGIEENTFKRHAACYYTHSAIDAARGMRGAGHGPDRISEITIGLQAGLHSVCDIVRPVSGLEVKFSIRHLVAMALLGRDTTDPNVYTDTLAADPDVIALRDRTTVVPLETANRMKTRVHIALASGETLEKTLDVSAPAQDLDLQEQALTTKFIQLATPVLGGRVRMMASAILSMDTSTSMAPLLAGLIPEP
ncbi:MAG: MmgE/PrpD family protein [Pseudomonadota bacterium]